MDDRSVSAKKGKVKMRISEDTSYDNRSANVLLMRRGMAKGPGETSTNYLGPDNSHSAHNSFFQVVREGVIVLLRRLYFCYYACERSQAYITAPSKIQM